MSNLDLISLVIPNWNGKQFLAGCLDSLSQQSYKAIEVIVVDNGSVDGSTQLIESNYPWVRLLRFEENQGFSPAVNRGIRESKGKFIALLNNDTVVDSQWLEELIAALKAEPTLGSVASKMLAYHDHSILDGAGDGYRRGGLPGRIGHREKDAGQFDSPRYVLGACGGAALYRKEVFDKIGLFDEDYFAYLEDIDLALRAQSAGFKCLYVPTAIVYHLGCGTTGSGYSPLVVRLSAQNNINTLVKNIPLFLLFKFLPYIFYWQAYYFACVLLLGRRPLAWFAGSFSALRQLPKMIAKRQMINQERCVPISYLEQIIVQSEKELADSRHRLYAQIRLDRKTKLKTSSALPE
jgi:GT2 family glycosyltransferase